MTKQLIISLTVLFTATSVFAKDADLPYLKYKKNETLVFRSGTFARKDKKVTFYRDEHGVSQYRIPDITVIPDDRLLATVVARCSQDGDHAKSTSFFAVSEDDGKSWEKITFSTDYKNISGRPKKDFPMTERTQETQVVWHPGMRKFVAIFLTQNSIWYVTSKDLEKWSDMEQADIDMRDVKNYWPSPSSLQVDDDGSLFFAITGNLNNGDRFARLVWTEKFRKFEVSPNMPVDGNETAVVPVSGNKYFVTTRISPQRLNMTYDRDTETWSDAVPFPEPHHWRCMVDLVNDGKALYMATPTRGRDHGRLYRSKDEGETWKEIAELSDGDHFGYSSLVVLKDGDIGVLAERGRQSLPDGVTILNDIVFQRIPPR